MAWFFPDRSRPFSTAHVYADETQAGDTKGQSSVHENPRLSQMPGTVATLIGKTLRVGRRRSSQIDRSDGGTTGSMVDRRGGWIRHRQCRRAIDTSISMRSRIPTFPMCRASPADWWNACVRSDGPTESRFGTNSKPIELSRPVWL